MKTIETIVESKKPGEIFWVGPADLEVSEEIFNAKASRWLHGETSGFVCLSVHRESQTAQSMIARAKLQKYD